MNPSPWFGPGGDSGLQVLWEDGERVFCRGERYVDGRRAVVLAVLPADEHPTPAALDRLAREYGLRDELDATWALRPLELIRERGLTMLVLEDTRSEPLDRLHGVAMEMRSFLRLAVAVAAALSFHVAYPPRQRIVIRTLRASRTRLCQPTGRRGARGPARAYPMWRNSAMEGGTNIFNRSVSRIDRRHT